MSSLRSTNRQTPRKKYTVDAFEGIEELQSNQIAGDEDGAPVTNDEDDQDDFNTEPESVDPEEDDISDENDASEGENAIGLILDAREVDSDDALSTVEETNGVSDDDLPGVQGSSTKRRGERAISRNDNGERLYTRGADESNIFRRSGRIRLRSFYGSILADNEPIVKTFARWSLEGTFPTRESRQGRYGGLEYPPAYQAALENVDSNWKWYASLGGTEAIKGLQTLRTLTADLAKEYLHPEGTIERRCILGPLDEQKLYQLEGRQSVALTQPFQQGEHTPKSNRKHGFLLNLGARVHALDWAPNQAGRDQYLAVSTLPEREEEHPRLRDPIAPAFKPRSLYPSSIQIWCFRANAESYIDTCTPPHLAMVLCTDIGDVKCLKWCPIPSNIPSKLGLLACIGVDGDVAVLDVDRPWSGEDTCYVKVDKFLFKSKPPNTICTCLTWLSSTRIAAGCANGMITVWDLPECLRTGNPRPILYFPVGVTYILSIASCWSSYPNFVVASSMSGHLTLTDLSKPHPGTPSNTAVSSRTRVGQLALAWNDHTQSAFSVDDGYTLKSHMLRRFFSTVGVGRYRALVLCVATSPCHPYILAGAANGEAVSSNPIVRIAHGSKAPLWQQIWFKHEWRRPTNEEQNLTGQSRGLTRILEGYKVESVNLNSDGRHGPNVMDGTLFATIYEENTAITALAWNPNIHVGGWAAAGMADGLLRVEDIAL